jgi:predicted 2-oxoglutarate/Fe(II)-dependent dioxygenase YbiX
MNYSVNTYFTSEECSDIIKYCMENGEIFFYDPKEVWDCRRIYNDDFKEKILNKLITNYQSNNDWFNFNDYNVGGVNISLTRYYDGRFLNLHKDTISEFTTVIVLTDGFEDGRFVISDTPGKEITDMGDNSEKIKLEIGEGISFDGSKTYHGVMPVYKGIRCALNIWLSEDSSKYVKFKNKKTII